jgi:hypothetical protein
MEKPLVTHFPWRRLTMTALINASMILTMKLLVDWLYYFCTLPVTEHNASVVSTAITALSAGVGVMFICMSAVNIWFITGSTKTVEAMFKFNAATMAQTAMQAAAQTVNEQREETITERIITVDETAPNANLRANREDE